MRGGMTTVLMLLVIGALIVLVARQGGAVSGFSDADLASLVYKLGFLILVGAAALRIFRNRIGEAVQAALLWLIVGLLLVTGYAYRYQLKDAGNRIMAELVPGRVVAYGRTVEIARTNSGEFKVATEVNGARVPMVLDSGATTVMLTRDAALAAGLPVEMLKYTVGIETANGRTQAAAATIDRIAIGGIVERAVPALIAQPGQLKESLLGMSFLSRLQSWEVRGDHVVMRGEP